MCSKNSSLNICFSDDITTMLTGQKLRMLRATALTTPPQGSHSPSTHDGEFVIVVDSKERRENVIWPW